MEQKMKPEAREDGYEIGTPREFAERLAWMTTNGKPDLDQWENHIKFRDAALSRLAAPKPEGLKSCTICANRGIDTDKCDTCFNVVNHAWPLFKPAAPEPRPAEEPDPAPSEEAIDHELVAYGRFAVALWRCSNNPGGMDWIETAAKMLREHDAALRLRLEEAEAEIRRLDLVVTDYMEKVDALRSQLAQATNSAGFWRGENSKTVEYYGSKLARKDEGLRMALEEAAQSLEALAGLAGKDETMLEYDQVRGYALNRAMAARAALRESAPVASRNASDTIRNAGSVSHDNREPDGRKGE